MKIVGATAILLGLILVFVSVQGAYMDYLRNEEVRRKAENPRRGYGEWSYLTPPYSIWTFWNGGLVWIALAGLIFIFAGTTMIVKETKLMKTCPYCAERIRQKAILCRYCRKELP